MRHRRGGGYILDNQKVRRLLQRFTAISLREQQSVAQLIEMTGKPVVDVCDPSLLIDKAEYAQEAKYTCFLPKHYIAFMDMTNDPFAKEVVIALRKRLKMPIVSITGNYYRGIDRHKLGLSPEKWLYVMAHADCVCTNSFHGTAFSVVFERPFVCCQVKVGGRAKTNGRVENLLAQCDLSRQYVSDFGQIDTALDIDYALNRNAIDAYKTRSFEWLKKSLSDATDKK